MQGWGAGRGCNFFYLDSGAGKWGADTICRDGLHGWGGGMGMMGKGCRDRSE